LYRLDFTVQPFRYMKRCMGSPGGGGGLEAKVCETRRPFSPTPRPPVLAALLKAPGARGSVEEERLHKCLDMKITGGGGVGRECLLESSMICEEIKYWIYGVTSVTNPCEKEHREKTNKFMVRGSLEVIARRPGFDSHPATHLRLSRRLFLARCS
jgi:hypothetical protein